MKEALAQALVLLEMGKDQEAEALLLTPREGPLEAERLAHLDAEVLEVSQGTPSLESLFLRLFGPATQG